MYILFETLLEVQLQHFAPAAAVFFFFHALLFIMIIIGAWAWGPKGSDLDPQAQGVH
jgi:hypothetical protein